MPRRPHASCRKFHEFLPQTPPVANFTNFFPSHFLSGAPVYHLIHLIYFMLQPVIVLFHLRSLLTLCAPTSRIGINHYTMHLIPRSHLTHYHRYIVA